MLASRAAVKPAKGFRFEGFAAHYQVHKDPPLRVDDSSSESLLFILQ